MSKDFNDKPKIFIYKQEPSEKRVIFRNRFNIEYDILDYEYQKIGNVKSYKDYLQANLNPVLDNQKSIYGKGRTFEPKSKTIYDMRSSLDNGLNILKEQAKKQKSQNTQPTQPQQEQPKGDNNKND